MIADDDARGNAGGAHQRREGRGVMPAKAAPRVDGRSWIKFSPTTAGERVQNLLTAKQVEYRLHQPRVIRMRAAQLRR